MARRSAWAASNSHLVSSAVYTLPYDVLRDFEPVALLSRSGGGLIVARKTLPAEDLRGCIAWAQGEPGQGGGGKSRRRQLGPAQRRPVPEHDRDAVSARALSRQRPAMLDLVAGQIDMIIAADVTTAVAQLRAGAPGLTDSGSIGFQPSDGEPPPHWRFIA